MESFTGRYDEFQSIEIGRTGPERIYACRFNDFNNFGGLAKHPVFMVLERHHAGQVSNVRAINAFQETWAGTPKLAARMITVHYYIGAEFRWVYKITST